MRGTAARHPSLSTSEQSGSSYGELPLGALLLASCVIVPLVFTIAQRDAFALTKMIALQIVAGVGLLILARRWSVAADRPRLVVSATDGALLAFFALNLVACIRSIRPLHSLLGEPLQYQGFWSVLLYAWFFYIARISIADQRRMDLLFASIAAGATVVALYAVAQKMSLDPLWSYPPFGRPFSTIGQSNALAAYLVVAIHAAVALVPRMRAATSRTLVLVAIGLMGIVLLTTKSRGGYLGIAAPVCLFAVPLGNALRLTARRIVGAVGIVALLLVAVPSLREQAMDIWRRGASSANVGDISVRRHLDLWAVAAAIARDHPFVGTGQETFPEVFPRYAEAVLGTARASTFQGVRAESPHNVYLAIAAGAGLPALAAYLSVIGGVLVTIVRAIKTRRDDWTKVGLAAIVAAIAGHLVTDAFMTAEVTSSWLFWVIMGAGFRLARQDQRPLTTIGPPQQTNVPQAPQ